jgi:hypothetical protein
MEAMACMVKKRKARSIKAMKAEVLLKRKRRKEATDAVKHKSY